MYFAVYTGIDLLVLFAKLKQAEAENQVLQEQIAVVSRRLKLVQEKKQLCLCLPKQKYMMETLALKM